jgi:regulator of protease activity HflC (stomatin/prohibitin superfamily)
LFFIDKKFQNLLEPGNYYFWKGSKDVKIDKVDIRQQQLEIAGQEIMSKDKVTLRFNFVCQYKIIDPKKALLEIKNYSNELYILLQLVLREYVGGFTLDEILLKKQEIGDYVTQNLKEKTLNLGLDLIFAGVKDVILPGEIKDILNQVLIAEKKAQANVIMRREETASTRSLLNTAKLMEDNELLFKLKELEYIERISEKINQISISGGSQILEQFKQIFVSLKDENKT